MTPNDKTKFKDAAQTRALVAFSSSNPETRRLESEHYVEGYAARYEPYVLYYEHDLETGKEIPIYERFEPGCFAGADMSDVIMQYDHTGKVLARTGNGSLIVEANDTGLFFAADLGRTEAARSLYEDVKAGMVTKMSWRFRCGEYYYDRENHTIVHTRIAKVYDVAAVSIPANDNTEINARAMVDGEIAMAARREAELEERRRKLRTKINITLGGI
jgi:HK97 family phage prohead protease